MILSQLHRSLTLFKRPSELCFYARCSTTLCLRQTAVTRYYIPWSRAPINTPPITKWSSDTIYTFVMLRIQHFLAANVFDYLFKLCSYLLSGVCDNSVCFNKELKCILCPHCQQLAYTKSRLIRSLHETYAIKGLWGRYNHPSISLQVPSLEEFGVFLWNFRLWWQVHIKIFSFPNAFFYLVQTTILHTLSLRKHIYCG
jgi:hypothetical protein